MKKNEKKTVLVGTVKFLKYGTSKYDRDKKYRMCIECDELDRGEFRDVFEGNKFAPSWYTDSSDNKVNLKTSYDIPVKCIDEAGKNLHIDNLETFINSNMTNGASICVSINKKENAIYPKAVLITALGEEYDPFKDFE